MDRGAWGRKELDTTEHVRARAHTHTHTLTIICQLDCFSLVLHFLTSLIKSIHSLRLEEGLGDYGFFYKQEADREHAKWVSLCSLPCEDIRRRQPFTNQEESPHQTLDLLKT